MSAAVVNSAIIAGLLAASMGSAFAAGPAKTKAQCETLTDMQWDAKTKKWVKK